MLSYVEKESWLEKNTNMLYMNYTNCEAYSIRFVLENNVPTSNLYNLPFSNHLTEYYYI